MSSAAPVLAAPASVAPERSPAAAHRARLCRLRALMRRLDAQFPALGAECLAPPLSPEEARWEPGNDPGRWQGFL